MEPLQNHRRLTWCGSLTATIDMVACAEYYFRPSQPDVGRRHECRNEAVWACQVVKVWSQVVKVWRQVALCGRKMAPEVGEHDFLVGD